MSKIVCSKEIYRYYKVLSKEDFPEFLNLYCMTPSLQRLEGVGYFCGADYHQIEKQRPKYFYSRLDHSLACSLIIWHFTKNRIQTIYALLHDVGSPCFSHAFDYGLQDSKYQESSERDIKNVIKEDSMLQELLYLDGIDYRNTDITRYPLIESKRPRLCVDRLEGIFSSNLMWSNLITIDEIKEIYQNIDIMKNEQGEDEFGFIDVDIAKKCFHYNKIINNMTESKEDRLTMSLLGDILCYGIKTGSFTKEDLYNLTEYDIIEKIKKSKNTHLKHYFYTYQKLTEVKSSSYPRYPYYTAEVDLKKRVINPLVTTEELDTVRLSSIDNKINQEIIDYENSQVMDYPYIKLKWNSKKK